MERKIQRKQKNTQGKGTIWRETQKCKSINMVCNRAVWLKPSFLQVVGKCVLCKDDDPVTSQEVTVVLK